MTRLLQTEHHLLDKIPGNVSRLDVLEGPTGRRTWPDWKKAEIVLESHEPGARVRDVALRHGMAPQHLSTWRRLARDGKLPLPDISSDLVTFAEIEVAEDTAVSPATPSGEMMEVEFEGVCIRLRSDAPASRIAEIASALRSSR